jgi:hypothetical protein
VGSNLWKPYLARVSEHGQLVSISTGVVNVQSYKSRSYRLKTALFANNRTPAI